jgi:hypothetical protein
VDINVFIFSIIFFCIYQLRIGTKSVFEFHNYRSVLFHGIWKLKKASEITLCWLHNYTARLSNVLNVKGDSVVCPEWRQHWGTNRLTNTILQGLMMVSIHGPDDSDLLQQFYFIFNMSLLILSLSKRDFITIFFKVLIFLLIPVFFQPRYVSF